MNNIFDKILEYWNNEEIQEKFKKKFLRPILIYIGKYFIVFCLFEYVLIRIIHKLTSSKLEYKITEV